MNFLAGHKNPEQDALLRLIGTSIVNPHGVGADGKLAADGGREWSNAELKELGDMLLRGLSIEEIARGLRRDQIEVRNKVAEGGARLPAEGRRGVEERA